MSRTEALFTAADGQLTLDVGTAIRAEREAFQIVRQHLDGYARARSGMNAAAISHARTSCELAALAWVNAVAAQAQAEDHRDPARAGNACSARQVFKVAGPSSQQCERAWTDYQDIRRSGNAAAIATAHDRWRAAFVSGFEEMAARWAREDGARIEEWRTRRDASLRVGDALSSGRSGAAAALTQASKERTRRESSNATGPATSATLPDGAQPGGSSLFIFRPGQQHSRLVVLGSHEAAGAPGTRPSRASPPLGPPGLPDAAGTKRPSSLRQLPRAGPVRARAVPLRAGRDLVVAEVRVTDAGNGSRLLSKSTPIGNATAAEGLAVPSGRAEAAYV